MSFLTSQMIEFHLLLVYGAWHHKLIILYQLLRAAGKKNVAPAERDEDAGDPEGRQSKGAPAERAPANAAPAERSDSAARPAGESNTPSNPSLNKQLRSFKIETSQ